MANKDRDHGIIGITTTTAASARGVGDVKQK